MYSEHSNPKSTENFYDYLTSEYHLIFADWKKSVQWHGRILDNLIRRETKKDTVSVLDCTCGIGTQAIGLALYGHSVHGSDISSKAIDRAEKEAESFGTRISFTVSDILDLDKNVSGSFDVVISCDNSLPHLLNDADLKIAINNVYSKLKPGGIFLTSIRDYDQILKDQQRASIPQIFNDGNERRIVFQTWDWLEDEVSYVFHLFILRSMSGNWSVSEHTGQYRALRRQDLSRLLSEVPFYDIHWLMPQDSGYYQPIVICHR